MNLKIQQVSPEPDQEDMGSSVGPLLSFHHIPSARSKDSGHRFSVGVLLSVWVVNREDSQSADGNGVFSSMVLDGCQ